MTATQRPQRAGFTLVEILMVIAIIAVLASLLLVGVNKAREIGKRTQCANDLAQLDTVLAAFKKDVGFYPPSHVTTTAGVMRFMVPTNMPTGGSSPAAQQNDKSFEILQRMFPRWRPTDNTTGAQSSGGTIIGTVENLKLGSLPLSGKPLDPNQAMVYFLGGPNGNGFDVATPYEPSGSSKKGPYLEFTGSKLAVPDTNKTSYSSLNGLPNYVDPWGMPYAYFAANGDAYDGRLFFPFGSSQADLNAASATYSGGTGMRPVRMGNKWVNPGRCQIVSAGPNGLFGPGSPSASPNAPSYSAATDVSPGQSNGYNETSPGEDDRANFNEGGALGTAP